MIYKRRRKIIFGVFYNERLCCSLQCFNFNRCSSNSLRQSALGLLSGFGICFKENWEGVLAQTGEFAVSIAPFTRITKYTQLQNIVIQYFFRNFAATKTKGFAKNKKGVCFTLVFSVGNYHFQKIVQKNNIVVSVCFNNSECEKPQTEEQI